MSDDAEERRRSRIRRRIREKQRIVDKCVSAKNKIRKERINLEDSRDHWIDMLQMSQRERITGEIVVENVFEGRCAEQLRSKIYLAISAKTIKEQQVGELLEDIEELLINTEQYISELEDDISDLYSSL